jgi:hypothetical protein
MHRSLPCLVSSEQTDFIVLPCDFVPPPNLLLSTVLDSHRTRQNATLTSLFYERADVGKEGQFALHSVPPGCPC